MPYSHYGEIGDVWKHLPLCTFLMEEKPVRYVESNSASPAYALNHSEQRKYGIFHLYMHASDQRYANIAESPYLYLLRNIPGNEADLQSYVGSPGLALNILKAASHYLFCDIEAEPLQRIMDYAKHLKLNDRLQVAQGDSIDYLWTEIEKWGEETFLHIDPYRIFEKNANDICYFDLFVKAAQLGIKTMLWYGYETLDEQKQLHAQMRDAFSEGKLKAYGIDFYIESIGRSAPATNPGVPGCGIVIAHLSQTSVDAFKVYAKELEEIYLHAQYQGKPARLLSLEIDYNAWLAGK